MEEKGPAQRVDEFLANWGWNEFLSRDIHHATNVKNADLYLKPYIKNGTIKKGKLNDVNMRGQIRVLNTFTKTKNWNPTKRRIYSKGKRVNKIQKVGNVFAIDISNIMAKTSELDLEERIREVTKYLITVHHDHLEDAARYSIRGFSSLYKKQHQDEVIENPGNFISVEIQAGEFVQGFLEEAFTLRMEAQELYMQLREEVRNAKRCHEKMRKMEQDYDDLLHERDQIAENLRLVRNCVSRRGFKLEELQQLIPGASLKYSARRK